MLLPALVQARRLPETIVRIGLVEDGSSVNMSCEGSYYFYEINSGKRTDIQPLNDYLLKGDGDRIAFDGETLQSPVRIVTDSPNSKIRINGRRFRDNMLLSCKNGKLTVINELGLEDYIRGILPQEVNPAWHEEALKAQAVCSRTYALRNLRKHTKQGFDLCNKTHCQVFGGMESETERTNKAVDDTRGEVLTFNGELASTLFHACCSGHTENPNNVWAWEAEAPAYLKGRSDKFCSPSPYDNWKGKLETSVIMARLIKAGYNVGTIKKMRVSGKSSSGRAEMIRIVTSRGTINISAGKFRLMMDPWVIKSTMINDIVRYRNSFEFRGSGWGHGVGMCQWGAKVMAAKGYDYKEILKYYYSGTDIEAWEE
jgi:stage II sporulation protein D